MTSEQVAPWLPVIIALVTGILGTGGIAAWQKQRHDKKAGIAAQESADDDALSNRWKAVIEAQTKALLEPMQTRLQTLETKVEELENELAASRRKYWAAISYVRTLLTWIARHMPDDIEHTQVPQPPTTVVEDI